MKYYIVIPAHNEEKFIGKALASVAAQTLLPAALVVVNDASTDNTADIAAAFAGNHSWAGTLHLNDQGEGHLPGGKVIRAFYKGLEALDNSYDIIVKMDADVILPPDYFETLAMIFKNDPSVGIAGGLVYIEQRGQWVYEPVADKNHVRGPVKAYSRACFEKMGGLRAAIGWDTADTLLARYYGFKVQTTDRLIIRHLRPTGKAYTKKARLLQGQAMYTLRYGLAITLIASLKTAWRLKQWQTFLYNVRGYFRARKNRVPFLADPDQGKFIRKYRWRGMLKKTGISYGDT
ncbi:glycosyltransferase family 2 protein [Sinomicrobium soli]|nr:glycosyltransferase family 2 protein [Sinomicrobium sp. N-1-3-6]